MPWNEPNCLRLWSLITTSGIDMGIANFLKSNGGNTLDIMCLGDSITVGYSPRVHYGPKNGYRYRLWYHLRRADMACKMVGPFNDGGTYAAWSSAHAGINGTSLMAMIGNAPAWIAAHKPDLVVLLGGVNDLPFVNVATTAARLETLIQTIQATPQGPAILVSTITIDSVRPDDCAAFNALIPGICLTHGVNYVDAGAQCDHDSGLLIDNVHPNSIGFELIAETLATAILSL